MPIISRFYGIIIKMFFREHSLPHIHVVYDEYVGIIDLRTFEMLEGDLPPRALSFVQEWGKIHAESLQRMWDAKECYPLPPLV